MLYGNLVLLLQIRQDAQPVVRAPACRIDFDRLGQMPVRKLGFPRAHVMQAERSVSTRLARIERYCSRKRFDRDFVVAQLRVQPSDTYPELCRLFDLKPSDVPRQGGSVISAIRCPISSSHGVCRCRNRVDIELLGPGYAVFPGGCGDASGKEYQAAEQQQPDLVFEGFPRAGGVNATALR